MSFVKLIRADIRWSKRALECTDECDVNIAAYHYQQAVEKIAGYAAKEWDLAFSNRSYKRKKGGNTFIRQFINTFYRFRSEKRVKLG